MPPFSDDPDADWTDDYRWTRYRGPQPYPVPGDWVLDFVEGDGVIWYRYPHIGIAHESDDDVYDAFEPDYDAYEDAREETASLGHEIIDDDLVTSEMTMKQFLKIEGEVVFERVDPNSEDLWAAVADALQQYDDGTPVDEIEATFTTGSKPAAQLREETIEQRKQENESLGVFGGDGSD